MKNHKFLLFLLGSLLTISCSKTENPMQDDSLIDENLTEENLLISVNIVSDEYYTTQEFFSSYGHLYLTDDEGNLINDAPLSNTSFTKLEDDFDIENESYTVTFLHFTENLELESKSYNLTTFINVEPYELEFKRSNKVSQQCVGSCPSITLTNAVEGNLDYISMLENFSLNPKIDDNLKISITPKRNPHHIFTTFKNSSEDFYRYLWYENLTVKTNETIDYKSVPVVDGSFKLEHPPHDYLVVNFFGVKAQVPHIYRISSYDSNRDEKTNQTIHFYPEMFFDSYKLRIYYTLNDRTYYISKNTKDPGSSYNVPNLDFETSKGQSNNYTISSESNFDFYNVNLSFRSPDDKLSIDWNIYGRSESEIKFVLPKIEEFDFRENQSFTMDSLNVGSTKIINYNNALNYKDFILQKMDFSVERAKSIALEEYVEKR